MKQKVISIVLVLALLTQLLPVSIFAAAKDGTGLTAAELLLTDGGSLAAAADPPAELRFEEISLREGNVKHFRMTDGSYRAVVYDTPVHYLDEDGVWQEYDNTLLPVGRGGETTSYCVENGDSLRVFAADAADGELLSVQKGSYALSITPAGDPDQPAAIGLTETAAEVLAVPDTADEFQPADLYSALEYPNALNGATLRYENYANSVKESIVIDAPRREYVFSFWLQTVGLTPELLEDGSAALTDDSGAEIYTIPAPYMIDANDELSHAAAYSPPLMPAGSSPSQPIRSG